MKRSIGVAGALLLVLVLSVSAGCTGADSHTVPVPSTLEGPTLRIGEQAGVYAAAISHGYFMLAVQSRAVAGDTFYVVEPAASPDVKAELRASPDLTPGEITWVDNLEAIPHDPVTGMFTDGYAVSVGEIVPLASRSVVVKVQYYYGELDSTSVVRSP
jgi:hypothetical protein